MATITTSTTPTIFKTLTTRSSSLPYKFPTKNNLLINHCTTSELQHEAEQHAISTHPIIHSQQQTLLTKFLQIKATLGTTVEKQTYTSLTSTDLIHRLITKRPLMFMQSFDQYLLKDGKDGAGSEKFDQIGTKNQTDLTLDNLMSYDEMQLSSLLAVSTPTHFINDGGRNNMGRRGSADSHVKKGVIIGQVGTRFERKQRMEWCHCVVDETQNRTGRGYGDPTVADSNSTKDTTVSRSLQHDRALLSAWAEFYNIDYFPTFDEVKQASEGETKDDVDHRYIKLSTLGKTMLVPICFLDFGFFVMYLQFFSSFFLLHIN